MVKPWITFLLGKDFLFTLVCPQSGFSFGREGFCLPEWFFLPGQCQVDEGPILAAIELCDAGHKYPILTTASRVVTRVANV